MNQAIAAIRNTPDVIPDINLDTNLEDLTLDQLIELTRVPSPLRFDVIEITPDVAKVLLKFNTPGPGKKNRNVKWHAVRNYADDMRQGRWLLTGQPIIFDKHGIGVDLQHRMYACIEAKVPFRVAVVRGVEPDAFMEIDAHSRRRYSDALSILGQDGLLRESQAILTRIYEWEQGQLGASYSLQPSNKTLEDVRQRHPGYKGALKVISPLRRRFSIAHSAVAACYYLFRKADARNAELFIHTLLQGVGLDADSPIRQLRNRFENQRKSNHMDTREVMAITIKAWNAWLSNRSMELLVWRSSQESFPNILNLKGAPARVNGGTR
jgi:hypothetical protein